MKINEMFVSIQGEGIQTGLPTTFVRTTGCNLRCVWCDTKYAYEEGKEMTIEHITDECCAMYPRLVCITGGEPLLHGETPKLINALIKHSFSVNLETNGSLYIPRSIYGDRKVCVSMDLKCPSSKMHESMDFRNIRNLTGKDQLKFIITDRTDYEYAVEIMDKYNPDDYTNVIFQPCAWKGFFKSIAQLLSEWIQSDQLDVRLMLQNHKIIWPEVKRGV